MNDNESPDRESILSVARKWLPWCLALIFVLTVGWTGLIAYTEIANTRNRSAMEILIAVVNGSAVAQPAIVLYSFLIVTAIDAVGGFIVVTKRYLEEKWLKPQRERLRKEAIEEGRREGIREGIKEGIKEGIREGIKEGIREGIREAHAWNRRRLEAEARGITFDEPFPGTEDESPPANGTAQQS